jgi:hypothetical protein
LRVGAYEELRHLKAGARSPQPTTMGNAPIKLAHQLIPSANHKMVAPQHIM